MGYTHYWTPVAYAPAEKKERFDKFFEICTKLYKNLPKDIKIAGGMGTGKPKFGEFFIEKERHLPVGQSTPEWITKNHGRCVWFNGTSKDGSDHETFAIFEDESEWSFCKTARKPYDLLVCACLIAARLILDYKISSDGREPEWIEAFEYYAQVIGDNVQERKALITSGRN